MTEEQNSEPSKKLNFFQRRKESARKECKEYRDKVQNAIKCDPSRYKVVKNLMTRAESYECTKPVKAAKLMKKAHSLADKESRIANQYLEALGILEHQKRLEEKKVQSLNSKYLKAMARGKIPAMGKIAEKLTVISLSSGIPCDIDIALSDDKFSDESPVQLLISDKLGHDTVITEVSCSSKVAEVTCDFSMCVTLCTGKQASIPLKISGCQNEKVRVDVLVRYKSQLKTHTRKESFVVTHI